MSRALWDVGVASHPSETQRSHVFVVTGSVYVFTDDECVSHPCKTRNPGRANVAVGIDFRIPENECLFTAPDF